MRRLLPIALSLAAVTAQADGSCKPVFDAAVRALDTPNHMTTTTTMGTKTLEQGESINTGSQQFLRMRGQWKLSPLSKQEQLKMSKENADDSTCKLAREDTVNGEPAFVYQVANEDTGTAEYFISKRSGLPLKEELDLGAGSHTTVRIEYGAQRAPALAQ